MNEIFSGCEGLTDLNLSGFDTSRVWDMSRMFKDCKNLSQLDLSSFNTSNVINMTRMFTGCSGLTSLNIKVMHALILSSKEREVLYNEGTYRPGDNVVR